MLYSKSDFIMIQLAGAVEYTNCISAEVRPPPNKCPRYDIKPSDGEAPGLEMWSTPLLPLLPGPLWPRAVAPNRVQSLGNPFSWDCRIHRLHLCREVRHHNNCPGYDIKPSDGEALALEIWGMWSIPSLPLLSCPLWLGVVAPDRVLLMG